MSLTPGARLGPYEIVAPLGAGGMGEVYRARDTKLNRDVAIKILLPGVASDPDRLARFSREAQVLASLNHPNIAHIHGLEDSDGVKALVLELVEGETLAEKLASVRRVLSDPPLMPGPKGPGLRVDEALAIARQIAEALEAAHESGIIHRDLKPANIKIRPDGTVKVLDFGLAKAMDPTSSSGAHAMNSPTLSIHATQAGVILGTVAYMSPEQARGRAVDKRSDIWAFGCVLFEMLTGRRAFPGDDVTDTIVSLVSKEPDWTALPLSVPSAIRRLLRRCLEKDPKRRLDSAVAARIEIDEALAAPSVETTATTLPAVSPTPAANRWVRILPWGIAGAAIVIAAVIASRGVGRERPTPVYASLDAPADYVLGEDDAIVSLPTRTPIVFTPDGRSLIIQLARAGKPLLVLRTLDRPDARPIVGTDDARVPMVSPDGKWVGFWTANELRRVPIEGGAATTICALKATLGPYGATWGPGDVIVFGDEASGRIMRVPAGGGTPVPVTAPPPSERRHAAPSFLPDGKRILFSDVSSTDATDSRLMVQSIDGGDARPVMSSGVDGRVLPSGQLVFMRLGTLMIAPFDAGRAETKGVAAVAMSSVMLSGLRGRLGADNTAAGMFAVSSLGTLAVVRGALTGPSSDSPLIWVTRDGRSSTAEPASGAPAGARIWSRIAPDRLRATVGIQTPMRPEMWIADWTRDTWTACGECSSDFGAGVWSPDGRQLLLGRRDTLVAHTLDGSAPDQAVTQEAGRTLVPMAWLTDGRIVYESTADFTSFEIKLLERNGKAGSVVVPLGVGSEPDVSPDGRWLAYTSAQTSGGTVVVQAFPGPGSRTQISAGGGNNAAWSADGRTLYYLGRPEPGGPSTTMVAVDITTGPGLNAGKPRELFRRPESQRCGIARCYDVSADGQRFLLRDRTSTRRESVTRMDLVLNWTATLGAR
ncbi:MAG: protein kinase [Acidobacteria bacterium]|nr:protein kinase [Acidobacteriota bacterium]